MRRVFLAVGIAVIAVVVAFKVWLGSDAMHQRVRAAVTARLGERVTLGDDFSVDWFGTVRLGPLRVANVDSKRPPVMLVEQLSVRPRWSALRRGSVEPGWVRFEGVTVEAGEDGADVRSLLSMAPSSSRGSHAGRVERQLPEFVFETLVARGSVKHQAIELAAQSGRLVVHHAEGEWHVEGEVVPAGGGSIHALGALSADVIRSFELRFDEAAVPLQGKLSGTVHLASEKRLQVGSAEWNVVGSGWVVENSRLASTPVGPLRLASQGRVGWNLEDGHVSVTPFAVSLGSADQIKVEGSAAFDWPTELVSFELHSVELEYRAAVSAMPDAFAPGELSREIAGPLSVKVEGKGPLRQPLDWQLDVKIDLTSLRRAARAQPAALTRPFVYKTTLFDGRPRELVVGPANPSYVPLAEVPPSLIRAVLLSEDSMFMTHQGFDFFEMKNDFFAQAENGGSIIRGASTMTQQLAKNLYLSREKTYARKVREAFLTLALEAAVPKERLLEIYLNIIEWGPGLNGVGEAARHYFGKPAASLTVTESAYLATIIPSPIRSYGFYVKGELPEVWQRRVAELLTKMHAAGDLSDEQYREALETPLHFARAE